jgi:hypothetical protein
VNRVPINIILQSLNPGKTRFATPHDSTVGVGCGFYWFSAAILLFFAGGLLKAFWDDKNWRGRFLKIDKKPKSLNQGEKD